ncbi:serine/threonine-protein kinase pakH-like [Octopus sinensis]|uniref:non-specific serine/threonine protein kinase n=1 Tax=Octopus sinensis TaxID=2607531 RepID=A0A6P7TSI5_9MOLL|nr:serine/threonine-protein kinase pakH-like [Octopus sinensis]
MVSITIDGGPTPAFVSLANLQSKSGADADSIVVKETIIEEESNEKKVDLSEAFRALEIIKTYASQNDIYILNHTFWTIQNKKASKVCYISIIHKFKHQANFTDNSLYRKFANDNLALNLAYMWLDLFDLEELLGKGAYATVYRAVDINSKKNVAIKIVDLNFAETKIECIQGEINALLECKCPNIISYHESILRVDIWSLGIMCIEMALGKPPFSDIPVMKALFLITVSHPPKLPTERFSAQIQQFVDLCLNRNPNDVMLMIIL